MDKLIVICCTIYIERTTDTPSSQDEIFQMQRVNSVCKFLDKSDGILWHNDWPANFPDYNPIESEYFDQQVKIY